MVSIEKAKEVQEAYAIKMEATGDAKYSLAEVAHEFNVSEETVKRYLRMINKPTLKPEGPRVLVFDIETSPILGNVWRLWKQNVGLNQIHTDWFVLSYAAKWLNEDYVFYEDLRGSVKNEDDSLLLRDMWTLLDEADIVITQNGKNFDVKKLNARFILNGFQPPSSFKHIDTCVIAKKIFGFTSNKLDYMTDKLCKVYKKKKHAKFAGFELWRECLDENLEAWQEMEDYNRYDVLSLEELYHILAPWDKKHPNFNHYSNTEEHVCRCGSSEVLPYGYAYTQVSKFQRYKCKDCGAETRGRKNLFTKEERAAIQVNVAG